MNIIPTHLEGCFVVEPTVFKDSRGFFYESYNQEKFNQSANIQPQFLQDNLAQSQYGVVRGLHMQLPPYAQAKLVTCLQGRVLDVALDARKKSPTYGQYFSIELTQENQKQLFIPKGFLHGYSVLSETALFSYKCDNVYHTNSEAGIHPLDETINLDWGIPFEDIILSEKDQNAPLFSQIEAVEL